MSNGFAPVYGEPPKTKLPSLEKYRYFCPAINCPLEGNVTTAAPLLKRHVGRLEVWVTGVVVVPAYPVTTVLPRPQAPLAVSVNIMLSMPAGCPDATPTRSRLENTYVPLKFAAVGRGLASGAATKRSLYPKLLSVLLPTKMPCCETSP